MPEYLAPGVYVEETSFRARSIEGVSTSTAAFVGPTLTGPVGGTPDLLTSLADFERIFGGVEDLACSDASTAVLKRNHVAHAVRAFFDNGGGRLYVIRAAGSGAIRAKSEDVLTVSGGTGVPDLKAWFTARFEGAQLNNASIRTRQVALPISAQGMRNAPEGSVVRSHVASGGGGGGGGGATTTVEMLYRDGTGWIRRAADGATSSVADAALDALTEAYLLTLSITVTRADGAETRFEGLGYHDKHPNYIGTALSEKPARRRDALTNPVALHFDAGMSVNFFTLATALVGNQPATKTDSGYVEPGKTFTLSSGADGALPSATDYNKSFKLLRALMDVAMVAAPGYAARGDSDRAAIEKELITHVDDPRLYRVGILDAPAGREPTEMVGLRGMIDSKRAALYYPWVTVANPLAAPSNNQPPEIDLPPSGFICGVIARNDIERGVHKAPANEVVRGAVRFERNVNYAEQELLNPIGVNCLRLLPGRGLRVWGARTISSDPEWKYLNVRRYFNYVEASIDRGTQWAVFEPNGELLWASVRGAVSDFLFAEWRNGALLGTKPEEAFFVRCDRTTMTQNDLDNGRLVCLIGTAVVKPAEFVIFRIGQKTADAKS